MDLFSINLCFKVCPHKEETFLLTTELAGQPVKRRLHCFCVLSRERTWRIQNELPQIVAPGASSGGFSAGGFAAKSAQSQKAGSQWQAGKPQSTSTSWPSQSQPKPPEQSKPGGQPKPNYTVNFSVIGGREERGIRAPGFGKVFLPPPPPPHVTGARCFLKL